MNLATPMPSFARSAFLAHAALVAVLQAGLLLGDSVRTDTAVTSDDPALYAFYKADQLLRSLLSVPIYALALQAIARLTLTGARRLAAMAVLLAGSALLATGAAASLPYAPTALRVGSSASMAAWIWYTLWANLVVVVLAQVAAGHLRARHLAVERLAEVQDRGRAARELLARAQLQAIQARVDPQLLFDTLRAVQRGYRDEAGRAERILDELAAFLRAALPRLRSARSSLDLECHLVASWTRLRRTAFDRQVRCRIDLPPDLHDEAFPAGLLLPLATDLLDGASDADIDIAAAADDRHVRISIAVRGSARDRDGTASHPARSAGTDHAARERLTAALADLYGERARCRWQAEAAGPDATRAVVVELEVPREPA